MATMLSLHIGLASVAVPGGTIIHGSTTAAPGTATTSLAAPCHDHVGTTHDRCCASSDCHCPGHCAMAAATQTSSFAFASSAGASPLITQGALSPPTTRELRPPIVT